ncbi:hypothetical protein VTK56DRAFT_9351 [Thermocarpiscus australiensis]
MVVCSLPVYEEVGPRSYRSLQLATPTPYEPTWFRCLYGNPGFRATHRSAELRGISEVCYRLNLMSKRSKLLALPTFGNHIDGECIPCISECAAAVGFLYG